MMRNYYNLNSSKMMALQKQLYNPAPTVQKPPSMNKQKHKLEQAVHTFVVTLHLLLAPEFIYCSDLFRKET